MHDMKEITQEEFDEIARKHKLALDGKPGGEIAKFENVRFEDIEIKYLNLDNAVFCDCYFKFCQIVQTSLKNVKFEKGCILGCYIYYCDFEMSHMFNFNIGFSNITACSSRSSTFEDVCIEESYIYECDFKDVNLQKIKLENTKVWIEDKEFILRNADKLMHPHSVKVDWVVNEDFLYNKVEVEFSKRLKRRITVDPNGFKNYIENVVLM